MSRISSASASIWMPRSSPYSVPASTSSVARGSRSRLRTFCDFAKVQTQSSPSRTVNHIGIECGQPRGPIELTTTIRSESSSSRLLGLAAA